MFDPLFSQLGFVGTAVVALPVVVGFALFAAAVVARGGADLDLE